MERNTLLAIVLSIAVLYFYQMFFVAPKGAHFSKNTQVSDNQEIKTTNASSAPPSAETVLNSTTSVEKTVDYTIKTTKSEVSYTNVGGALHKIDFIDNRNFPITNVLSINGFDDVSFAGQQLNEKAISFIYNNKDWQILKTFTVENSNIIKVRMEIKNISEISILVPGFTVFEIDDSGLIQNNRESALLEYSVYAGRKIFRKGNAAKFDEKNYKNVATNVNWLGFRDRYHAFIVKPEFETKSYEIKADTNKQLNISISPKEQNLSPGQNAVYDFTIYAGPQNPGVMSKYRQGFEKIVAFSNFPIIEWIAQGIYYTIPFLHSVFHSWGIAIILVSSMIYGLTYPLTLKSMMSMRKMQEVQPKMAALKERYKNDPQKLNMEMMEIYRREKINPFGGCLPFLIQMPFFMALYQILWRAQYFEGQGFLWIKDLSQPDRLMTFPFYLPLFGNELNILPMLTGCMMFLQQKVTAKSMVVVDEQAATQQKMMTYVLPVMMTCMFYHFASSWAIYFLVFYILSTLTQLKIAQSAGKK